MTLELFTEILGWTSVAFYISITIFNSMKFTRFAAFGSAANDTLWAFLMGWWPKVILNLSVASLNTYRYAKDFTQASKSVILTLGLIMAAGIGYISYVAVTAFIAEPTLAVALQFVDLGIILLALYMTTLRNYRLLMLLSGFVGMAAYYGNTQMMIIKALVIGIMTFKLLFDKTEQQANQAAVVNSDSQTA
ncbi:phosphopyruvate hydratase [Shewanella sp. GXUN23E]|uniref:phosphopyruvate hydratase n=1 Tax=Shewanella sp. GXUN23E TaxID=3422498 RepID=UPI003D7CAFEA